MPYGQRQGKYSRAASPAFGQEEKDEEESKVYICAGTAVHVYSFFADYCGFLAGKNGHRCLSGKNRDRQTEKY